MKSKTFGVTHSFIDGRLYNINKVINEHKQMYEALKKIISIVNESTGVSGYHLNGGEAEWDEFDEIIELQSLLKEIESNEGN